MASSNHSTTLVFIVDPQPSDYVDLRQAGREAGLTLRHFCGGIEALLATAQIWPGLWIINARLEDMSGFDLAETLKARLPQVDVFLVANEYHREDEIRALSMGVAMYVCKPPSGAWLRGWRPVPRRGFFSSEPPRPCQASILDIGAFSWKE